MVSINSNLRLQQFLEVKKDVNDDEAAVEGGSTRRADADFPEPEVLKSDKPKPTTPGAVSITIVITPSREAVMAAVRQGKISCGEVFTNGNGSFYKLTNVTYASSGTVVDVSFSQIPLRDAAAVVQSHR